MTTYSPRQPGSRNLGSIRGINLPQPSVTDRHVSTALIPEKPSRERKQFASSSTVPLPAAPSTNGRDASPHPGFSRVCSATCQGRRTVHHQPESALRSGRQLGHDHWHQLRSLSRHQHRDLQQNDRHTDELDCHDHRGARAEWGYNGQCGGHSRIIVQQRPQLRGHFPRTISDA